MLSALKQCHMSNMDDYLRWPLIGPMQGQLGFLTVSWYFTPKIQPCTVQEAELLTPLHVL